MVVIFIQGVFSNCKQLRKVELNDGLQKIGNCASCACTSLERIKLPSTVTEVGDSAFIGCTNLREVVLNEGLKKTGASVFHECSALAVIKLPLTVLEVEVGSCIS